ncbi:MAG: PfkB family carbohydrate kinase [Phycisphaerae bacterium]|jgi:sugar/nucleoside kinase (ribokinase family)
MSLLVTGSLGIDTVTTPYGHMENVLGGCAVYFSFAATQYVPVRLVSVAGEDFPPEFRRVLESRNIDLTGLETRKGSKTFRWTGRFEGDMNEAETVDVQVNVLAERAATVPPAWADSSHVFLAVTHPTQQRELLSQLTSPELVVCDTVNLWIANERESLLQTLRLVTGVIINDAEARQLTDRVNLIEAGEAILDLGPKFVMIKKGEHGALLVSPDGAFAIPAYPSKAVRDPTGAGDSFAGGVMGYLALHQRHDTDALRRAMVRGTVAASFTIEDFSIARVRDLNRNEVDRRVDEFLNMLRLE